MAHHDADRDEPTDATIEKVLRESVVEIWESGNTDDLTVKRVRTVTEGKLELPPAFLKDDLWKTKSHTIIHDQVVCPFELAPSCSHLLATAWRTST